MQQREVVAQLESKVAALESAPLGDALGTLASLQAQVCNLQDERVYLQCDYHQILLSSQVLSEQFRVMGATAVLSTLRDWVQSARRRFGTELGESLAATLLQAEVWRSTEALGSRLVVQVADKVQRDELARLLVQLPLRRQADPSSRVNARLT